MDSNLQYRGRRPAFWSPRSRSGDRGNPTMSFASNADIAHAPCADISMSLMVSTSSIIARAASSSIKVMTQTSSPNGRLPEAASMRSIVPISARFGVLLLSDVG